MDAGIADFLWTSFDQQHGRILERVVSVKVYHLLRLSQDQRQSSLTVRRITDIVGIVSSR